MSKPLTHEQKSALAGDHGFCMAIVEAEDKCNEERHPYNAKFSFQSNQDRYTLLTELQKKGFTVVKIQN